MKSRLILLAVLLSIGVAVWAADVTGKWTALIPGRDGQMRETTFNFKLEGEKLTGTISGRQSDVPISDGKLKGGDISFTVIQSFGGNEVKSSYKGKVAGDEIKFTRTREGSDQSLEIIAKRAK
jgi:hypothetical protein